MNFKEMADYFSLGTGIFVDRLLGRRRPYFVWLMPTSRCNLRCSYCFGDFSHRPPEELPLETWETIIDELAGMGTRHISLTGGEPMMRKDTPRLAARIKKRGMKCLLNSNGFQIPEHITELAAVDLMSISLDGPEDITDAFRGEGSYRMALAAIETARGHGINVQILMTLTRDLERSFEHVLALAEKLDCFIGLNILRPRLEVDGTEGMPVVGYTNEARAFLAELLKRKTPRLPYPEWLLRRFLDWPYDYDHCFIAQKDKIPGLDAFPCIAGRFMMNINSSGDIFSCARHCYRDPLANCADGDVRRAWANLKPPPCRACLDFGYTMLSGIASFRPSLLFGLLRSLYARSG